MSESLQRLKSENERLKKVLDVRQTNDTLSQKLTDTKIQRATLEMRSQFKRQHTLLKKQVKDLTDAVHDKELKIQELNRKIANRPGLVRRLFVNTVGTLFTLGCLVVGWRGLQQTDWYQQQMMPVGCCYS